MGIPRPLNGFIRDANSERLIGGKRLKCGQREKAEKGGKANFILAILLLVNVIWHQNGHF